MLQQVPTVATTTPQPPLGSTRELAGFLAGLVPEAVPPAAIDAAKVMVLDLLGCMLGAMRTPEVAMAAGVMEALGGTPDCTAIGFRFRTSCQNAAYLNGVTSHVIELDDTHRDSITHVGSPVIPAALAMAERGGASGLEFLMSVVVGYEACLRVANAVQPSHWRRGFLSMGTCGTFGAAAASAHLLRLDADRLADALGLAGIQAGGLNSSIYGEGDMGKRLCPGHAAGTGIVSALLAERGFTGSRNIFEQRKGFCESFADDYDISRITADLGKVWEVTRTSLKPYSCCRYNHAAIDGMLDIMQAEAITAGDIAGITVRTYDIAVTNRPHRVQPHTLFDAKMSIPFSLAVAARKGALAEHDFTEDLLADTSLQDFAGQVRVEADAAMSAAFPREWPAEVQVALRDGRGFSRLVPYPKGEPEAPMTQAEVETKFRDLAHVAITPDAANQVIALVNGLDRATGVASLMAAITKGLRN
ncbi:MmgE/PrpD family protein [Humitalea sp. 24SJ18S-53]|uniref:MmgE/PrpD family protein n=1 Tax=Humitalea sp. 24SJ18S-53 TaxID=3422307 RepID=UPI003D664EE4